MMKANPGSAEPAPAPAPVRRAPKTATGENKVSCSACRTVKCKCVEDPASTRCKRCTRLDIPCVYQPHQRGRKRQEDLSSSRGGSTPPSPSRLQKRKRNDAATASPSVRSAPSLRTPTSNVRQYSKSPSVDSDDHDQQPGDRSHLDQPANSVYHDVADRSVFSIAGVMERSNGEDIPQSSVTPGDDPVALGLLSMAECDSLFGHYFDQLQTCVCLLDPAIHTAMYTRRASLQLFTAVLTVASKFFRPELYEAVLAVANRLVSQAIADCVCAIELVQAICILHYWKKPTDGRGWLRLGHAIRLGYQLDLHIPSRGKFPDDERAARLQIDRERTWISLYCFDSTMTQLSDRPSMMHQAPEASAWVRNIPYPLPSDGQLDFAIKTSLLSSEVRQLQSCKGNYQILRSGLRRVLDELHRSHQALTAETARVKLTSTSVSINKFSMLATQLLVECTSLSFAPRKHRMALLHSCVSTSLDLLDVVVEDFARKGIMPVIEDAHSVAVASTVVRLIRFMSYLDASAKADVLRRLTKVVIVCREAARGDQESHPAYLARFIHALLDKAHQSRQPSRASSPNRQLGMAPMLSPSVQQKTTPDQWWDEIGQFAYQEPLQPEHQVFWDGFPSLAGAMSTLSPHIPTRGVPGDPSVVDPLGSFSGLAWDADWDAAMLGIAPGN